LYHRQRLNRPRHGFGLIVANRIPTGDGQLSNQLSRPGIEHNNLQLGSNELELHGVSYEDIYGHNGDTLDADWPTEEPYQFDTVVMNPPYFANWNNNAARISDPRFRDYGKLAPKAKADYAFLLHGLYHLKPTGTMGIVLPHGALFRGHAEGKIREELIHKNQIDAVIGLPANIFYSTSIPTLILILKKDKITDDILFIDASNDFTKGKNQNTLTEENINKIVRTYQARQNVEKYAHVGTLQEIKDNDYNLNIPRFVDTFEEEKPVDIEALVINALSTSREIDELKTTILNEFNQLVGLDDEAQKRIDLLKELFK